MSKVSIFVFISLLFSMSANSYEKGMSMALYEKYSNVVELFTAGKVITPSKSEKGMFFVKVIQVDELHNPDIQTYVAVSAPTDAHAELFELGSIGQCNELEWDDDTSLWLTCTKDKKLNMLHLKFNISSGFFSLKRS